MYKETLPTNRFVILSYTCINDKRVPRLQIQNQVHQVLENIDSFEIKLLETYYMDIIIGIVNTVNKIVPHFH
jgi:hypothetical protein